MRPVVKRLGAKCLPASKTFADKRAIAKSSHAEKKLAAKKVASPYLNATKKKTEKKAAPIAYAVKKTVSKKTTAKGCVCNAKKARGKKVAPKACKKVAPKARKRATDVSLTALPIRKTYTKDNQSAISIQFKIGMVAPSGSGKTSLVSAICSEVQERLISESLDFWAVGTATQKAMQKATEAFNEAIIKPSKSFQPPAIAATSQVNEYQFAVSLPDGQDIGFSILDYPGGMLGRSDFGNLITPFIIESVALLVPVSSEILMYWSQTNGKNDAKLSQFNTASNMLLDCDNVILAIKNWLAYKRKLGIPAQLFFVPVKCEKYFNDNGGKIDSHLKLQKAIFERYVEPLEMTAEDKKLIQTNIFYVDTYGVLELKEISAIIQNGEPVLNPIFQHRKYLGKKRRTKNAYELLMSILKFQVDNRFKEQQIKTSDLSKDNLETEKEVERLKDRLKIARNKARERKNSYGFWASLWYTFFNDDKLDRLNKEVDRAEGDVEKKKKIAQAIFDQYQLSAQQCESLEKAVITLTSLIKSIPKRQCRV